MEEVVEGVVVLVLAPVQVVPVPAQVVVAENWITINESFPVHSIPLP